MVNKSKQKILMASLMMLGCSLCLFSCSNDDDLKGPTLEVVKGNYSGAVIVDAPTPKMGVRMAAANEAEDGTAISAVIKNDTLFFDDFLVKDMIEPFFSEEQVDLVVKALGKVEYKIAYKADFNGAKDSIIMEFAPKPLELEFSLGEENTVAVSVDISAADKGAYALEGKNLTFELSMDKLIINDEEPDNFRKTSLKYSLKQK